MWPFAILSPSQNIRWRREHSCSLIVTFQDTRFQCLVSKVHTHTCLLQFWSSFWRVIGPAEFCDLNHPLRYFSGSANSVHPIWHFQTTVRRTRFFSSLLSRMTLRIFNILSHCLKSTLQFSFCNLFSRLFKHYARILYLKWEFTDDFQPLW